MSISLNKKTGINLKKGSKISLEKEGEKLEAVCIGMNWGSIKKKGFLSMFSSSEGVDLDGSVTTFNEDKSEIETIYYGNLKSRNTAIVHSGDDLTGDADGDDGIDNEVISIDLKKVSSNVAQIVFYLNSYKGQDFADIPYSKIRIFEGTPKNVKDVFATFNLSADPSFAGNVSMVMGKLVRTANNWEFITIGEPLPTKKIDDTIDMIIKKYL